MDGRIGSAVDYDGLTVMNKPVSLKLGCFRIQLGIFSMRKHVPHILGTLLCCLSAVLLILLLHGGTLARNAPLMNLIVIVLVASRFGRLAGFLGTVISAILFAEFLFDPRFSLAVADLRQRST